MADDPRFAKTPRPPYVAVIFSSVRTPGENGYDDTADRMVALAADQPGFLGIESARGNDGFGITVSYWRSEADVRAWKAHAEHTLAQDAGKATWYSHYETRVATVSRAYPKSSKE